jgi:hypothetical protein
MVIGEMVMNPYWFRPNRNGDGLTPMTWQGWTITVGIPLAMVAANILLAVVAGSEWVAMAIALPIDALGVVALVIVARRKTEGDWRWRLGGRWVRNRDTDRTS